MGTRDSDEHSQTTKITPKKLVQSKHFCLAPWIHTFINTDGTKSLCCSSDLKLGNIKDSSPEVTFNSPEFQKIKQTLISDKPLTGCERCYRDEASGKKSLRQSFNHKFYKHLGLVNKDQFNLVSWDFRFSNLCNLSCRSCMPSYSSSWAKPAEYLGIEVDTTLQKITDKSFPELMKYIDNVEEIYFAGGEPLIMKEHYHILNTLIEKNKTDVRLIYNTNFTKTTYKGIDVFQLWNKFKDVQVCASIDAEGERAEYLRCGTIWKDIIQNRSRMKEICPDVKFWVQATTGVINALHIPDLHKSLYETGFISDLSLFNIQNIYKPSHMAITNISDEMKVDVIEKYKKHIDWLEENNVKKELIDSFQSVINLLDKNHFNKEHFWENIEPLDNYYEKNLLDVFPELIQLEK